MQLLWTYIASGITTASIYAIAATGLVLTYTTTGVFNFAHGGIGMMAAFTYWTFRFAWGWPAPIALFVVLFVLAPLTGALLEYVIMRRMEGVSDTTKLVVTLSLMLATIGAANWIWNPQKSRPIDKFFEGNVVTIFGVRLPWHQLIALFLAAAVAIGLRLLLTRARLGVAMRACVDDRSLASLNGARQGHVAMAAWAIGTALAALAGILISPTIALSQVALTLLIVNTYAAAMIGRLRSLPMTVVGALILGITNDLVQGYSDRISGWVHIDQRFLSGFYKSMPIVILFVVLLLLPQTRLRSQSAARTRERVVAPTWPGTAMFVSIVVVGAVLLPYILPKGDLFSLNRMWGLGIVGLSMIPLIGYAGQISLCQMSFAGVGMIMLHHMGQAGNPIALVWAAVVAGIVGFVVALPSLRLSGIYLALSTAAFAVLMDRWIFTMPAFTWFGHTFDIFNMGALSLQTPRIFGHGITGHRGLFMFGAVCFGVVTLLVVWIRRSTYGQRLIALKDSPAACATLCMNPRVTRLTVFTVSAAMAGFGGAVYGMALQSATPDSVNFLNGLVMLMVMVIGGLTSPGAALFMGLFTGSTVLANVVEKVVPFYSKMQTVMIGLVGIALGKNPNGFVANQIRPRWNLYLRHRRALAVVLGLFVALFVLRLTNVLGNWPFAWLCVAVLVLAPLVLHRATGTPLPRRDAASAADSGTRAGRLSRARLDAVRAGLASPGGGQ